MKHLTLFTLLLAAPAAHGQVITKLSNGTSTFYYDVNELPTIINNASDNDTIVLPGGPIACGGFTIDKRLTLIGAGILNNGTPVTNPTLLVYGFGQEMNIQAPGSNSSFHGIYFGRGVKFFGGVSNISFTRCTFNSFLLGQFGMTAGSNVVVQQCVFESGISSGGSNAPQNLLVENCVIAEGINFGQNSIASAIVTQCLILPVTSSNNINPGIQFRNNIFLRNTPAIALNTASSYYDNLFVLNGGSNLNWTNAIDGGGNIATQLTLNSIFVNVNSYTEFNENSDYHLTPGSPGLAMGSNGQVGLYGGPSPWKEGAIPFNPHWVSLSPSLGTTNGGTINVSFTGAAQEN